MNEGFFAKLLEDLGSDNPELATTALKSLIWQGESAIPWIRQVLTHAPAQTRHRVAIVLAQIGGEQAADALADLLSAEAIQG